MDERIAALEEDLARVRRELAAMRGRRWRLGRWRVALATLIVLALGAAPLGVLGANFVDLHPGSTHNPNINAIADAGITRGCFDTAHYCPDDYVTREQMASFLARTAGLGGNPPVTNAATAQLAGNSLSLNGWAANEIVRSAGAGSGATVFGLQGTYGVAVTVTIAAPDAGFVLLTGAGHFYAGAGASAAPVCAVITDPTLGIQSLDLCTAVGTVTGTALDATISPVVRFPVLGPGVYNYQFRIAKVEAVSTGSTLADNITLTALYLPFGAGGSVAQPLSVAGTNAAPEEGIYPAADTPKNRREYPAP